MDAPVASISAGTVQQLEQLEERVKYDARERKEISEKLVQLQEMRRKVVELRETKELLQRKLRHIPTVPVHAGASEEGASNSLSSEVNNQLGASSSKVSQLQQLEYELVAYRCAGITASVEKKGIVRIRFETSYKGEYFEPYYLQLAFTDSEIKQRWNTIPFFVPLSGLLKAYNDQEIKFTVFLNRVHNYLLAFVNRRQQLEEVSRVFAQYLTDNVTFLPGYHFIQLPMLLHAMFDIKDALTVIHLVREPMIIRTNVFECVRQRNSRSFSHVDFTGLRTRENTSVSTAIQQSSSVAFPSRGNSLNSEVIVHIIYKDLQSFLPSKVRCSDPGGVGLGRAAVKQAFLTLPLLTALQKVLSLLGVAESGWKRI